MKFKLIKVAVFNLTLLLLTPVVLPGQGAVVDVVELSKEVQNKIAALSTDTEEKKIKKASLEWSIENLLSDSSLPSDQLLTAADDLEKDLNRQVMKGSLPTSISLSLPLGKENPHLISYFNRYKYLLKGERPTIKGRGIENANELFGLLVLFCLKESPYYGNTILLPRMFDIIQHFSKEVFTYKAPDFGISVELHQGYLLLESVWPGVIPLAQKRMWLRSIEHHAELINTFRKVRYEKIIPEESWFNADVRHIPALYFASEITGKSEWKTTVMLGLKMLEQLVLEDGGCTYVALQNETFTYHSENVRYLALMSIAFREKELKELALKILIATKKYYPLSYHPKRVAEYFTAASWKHYWNLTNPNQGAAIVSYLTDDPYNAALVKESYHDMLCAILYKPTIVSKEFPKTFFLYDRNVQGPRVRNVDFEAAGTARLVHPFGTEEKIFTGMGKDSYVGAMILMSEEELNLSEKINNFDPKKWPLDSAIQSITCEVQLKPGYDGDPRRQKHRFLAQNERNSVTMGNIFSGIAASYRVSDKTSGVDAKLVALPWECNQQWIVLGDRLVGMLEIKALSNFKAFGVNGMMKTVSGRNDWGVRKMWNQINDYEYQYGKMNIIIHENNFEHYSTEYTDSFGGDAKKSGRLILHDRVEDVEKVYSAGDTFFYIVEIFPSGATASKEITRIEHKKLRILSLKTENYDFILVHNPGFNRENVKLKLPVRFSNSAVVMSAGVKSDLYKPIEKNQEQLIYNGSLEPAEHLLFVSSEQSHEVSSKINYYETIFK